MIFARRGADRRLITDLESRFTESDRYLDIGVEIQIVEQHSDGDLQLYGLPPLRVIDRVNRGGMFDRRRRVWTGQPSRNPMTWYMGENHANYALQPDELPDKLLIHGGEGSGKTRGVLAQWMLLRAFDAVSSGLAASVLGTERRVYLGGTAPTQARLDRITEALRECCRPNWYRWFAKRGDFELVLGVTFQLRSTTKRSEAEGSPIQGYNWIGCGSDEIQDSLYADADIEARGRSATHGRYKRCCTATAKDFAAFRTWRDAKRQDDLWHVARIPGHDNPFVHPEHWERMKKLGEYEYRRRVLAEDVRAPDAVYPQWSRAIHVKDPPRRAVDVTHQVLSGFASYSRPGASFGLLVGHDPGDVTNASVFLRAMRQGDQLQWWIVGEFVTRRTTQDDHAFGLKQHLQERFGLQHDAIRNDPYSGMERALVICDPHGHGEGRPDDDQYHAFRRHALDIFSAEPKLRQIKRRTRIEMLNRLLRAYDGTVRLYVSTDANGLPCAPETVRSIEDQRRDQYGRAEMVKKDLTDITHCASAVGFALWPFERTVTTDYTDRMGRSQYGHNQS